MKQQQHHRKEYVKFYKSLNSSQKSIMCEVEAILEEHNFEIVLKPIRPTTTFEIIQTPHKQHFVVWEILPYCPCCAKPDKAGLERGEFQQEKDAIKYLNLLQKENQARPNPSSGGDYRLDPSLTR